MSIDINGLSAKELETLITQARKRKTVLKKRKPVGTVRSRLTALAKAEGYTIDELFGTAAQGRIAKPARAPRKAAGTGAKVPPKYRNPGNPEQTWTGRGKHPRWMAEEIARGRKPEDFLIA